MALVDLTNVDPYREETRAQARAYAQRNASLQGIFDKVTAGVQAGQARRARLDEKNMAIRDREYAIANASTDQLTQAKTGSKFTDVQLQETGRKFKQEFYDAVQVYEASDKGDEARQAFEAVKSKTLGSARTIGASIEKLGDSMESFKEMARKGGISDAMNPSVRSFFNDLNDPETPADQFQIVTDPDTGQLKYQGKTSDGHDVDFFLDDLANGENQFTAVPKADMPKVVNNLVKDVTNITKRIKQNGIVADVTDWDQMGLQLDGRMDELFDDPDNFKSLASGLGYGYEELEAIKNGDGFKDDDGRLIENEEDLKAAMKEELLQQVESFSPHFNQEVQIAQAESKNEQVEQDKAAKKAIAINKASNLLAAVQDDSADYNSFIGNKITLNGFEGALYGVQRDGNKITLQNRKGDKGEDQVFDLSKPIDQAYVTSILSGTDYNLVKQTNSTKLYVK